MKLLEPRELWEKRDNINRKLLLDLQVNYLMNWGGGGGAQYTGNFCEAGEFHHSHVQVDNPMSVTCGRLNTIRTTTPQNVFCHTNITTQSGVNNKSTWSQ